MVFACQDCGTTLRNDDIDFSTGVARCHQCHVLMSLSRELGLDKEDADLITEGPVSKCRRASKPDDWTIDATSQRLRFERWWYHPNFLILALSSLFWNGMLIGWFVHEVHALNRGPLDILTGILLSAGGAILTYATLCGIINRTTLEVTATHLVRRDGPLPCPGLVRFRRNHSEVQRLLWEETYLDSEGRGSFHFSLHALMKNGQRESLLTGLPDMEPVVFLGQQIEKRLGIEDGRVAGDIV